MNRSDLIAFWRRLPADRFVHPDDVDVLARFRHDLKTDHLPGPWWGELRTARAFWLFLNPGFNEDTDLESANDSVMMSLRRRRLAGEIVEREVIARHRDRASAFDGWFNRKLRGVCTADAIVDDLCVLNLVAYKSTTFHNHRLIKFLPSSQLIRQIVADELAPLARVAVAMMARGRFDPVHYRFFCLGAHYRSELRFSWDNLDQARRSFETLKNLVVGWKIESARLGKSAAADGDAVAGHRARFWDALYDDFNAPRALGVAWEAARDPALRPPDKLALVREMDRVLGLGVDAFRRPEIAPELMARIREREQARASRQWAAADAIRDELAARGIQLMDTPDGTDWYRSP